MYVSTNRNKIFVAVMHLTSRKCTNVCSVATRAESAQANSQVDENNG